MPAEKPRAPGGCGHNAVQGATKLILCVVDACIAMKNATDCVLCSIARRTAKAENEKPSKECPPCRANLIQSGTKCAPNKERTRFTGLPGRFLCDLELSTGYIDCTDKAQNEFCGVEAAFACAASAGFLPKRLPCDGSPAVRAGEAQARCPGFPAGRSLSSVRAICC